jgi:predicted Holliday junction resolvase-like endonuclease
MNDTVWIKIIVLLLLLFIIVLVARMVYDVRVRVASLEVAVRMRPTTKEVYSIVHENNDNDQTTPNPDELENELDNMEVVDD